MDSSTAKPTHGALCMASSNWAGASLVKISPFVMADDADMCICFILSHRSLFLRSFKQCFSYCTHAFFDNPSISKRLFVFTQNPSYSEGTLMSTLLGSECVAQEPGVLVIMDSETVYFLCSHVRFQCVCLFKTFMFCLISTFSKRHSF